MTEKNNSFALLALVAIVAVVGLVVLMRGAGTSAQPIVLEKQAAHSGIAGNIGGNAEADCVWTHQESVNSDGDITIVWRCNGRLWYVQEISGQRMTASVE